MITVSGNILKINVYVHFVLLSRDALFLLEHPPHININPAYMVQRITKEGAFES